MIFSSPDFDAHESVHVFTDPRRGLKCIIAVHSTALGPAFGGCRMWPYPDEAAAMRDALRLSRGMSFKNAMAGLAYGGGKAVILGDPRGEKTQALFAAFGRAVNSLGGAYITAEDVGISVDDMRIVAGQTSYVSGIPQEDGYRGGDPSPLTALGVFEGTKAAANKAFGSPKLDGLTITIQGVGHVGYRLAGLLHEAGARLIVADLSQQNVARVEKEFGAKSINPDQVLTTQADILAPCALGGILNKTTIPNLKVKVVAGAANNQLATESDGDRLQDRAILYAPDYVINAGGIISVAAERDNNATRATVEAGVRAIGPRTTEIFEQSEATGRPPHEVADELAHEIIRAAEQERRKAQDRPAGNKAG